MRGPAPVLLLLGLVALGAVLEFRLGPAPVAEAHAVLERSNPAQNQELAEPPALVETWYSEPLERSLTSLSVLDNQGNAVRAGATQFSDEDPRYAAVAVPPDLGPGIYTVTYQNVSTVDGHQWSGSFSFIVLNADGSVPEGTAFQPEGFAGGQGFLPGAGDNFFRWIGLLAAVGMGGAAAFYLSVARPAAGFLGEEPRRQVEETGLTVVASLAVLAGPVLLLSGLGQLGLLTDRLGGPETFDDILFHTRTGGLWLARQGVALSLLLLLAPALFSERWRSGARAVALCGLGLVGSVGLLMTYSLGSHAGAGGGAFWAVASDFVHFAATAAWVGGLLQLGLVFWWTRERLGEPDRLLYRANVLDRFSWLAVISVSLLIGTGVFNGFVQLPNRPALWETTYGRVLIAKLALILPLLGVAGLNALFLKPRLVDAIDALHADDPDVRAEGNERASLEARLVRLRHVLPRTVLAELLLGVAVLFSVAILAQTTTAGGELRQAAGEVGEDYSATQQAGDLDVELTISPFGLGVNTFTAHLTPQPGVSLGEVSQVELRAQRDDPTVSASAGQGFTSQELERTDDPAVFAADGALLSQPGDWRVEVRVRRRGVDDVVAGIFVPQVGGFLARADEPEGLFDLPFTFVDWNIVAGGALATLGLGAFLIWRNRPPSWQRSTATSVGLSGAFAVIAGAVLIFGVQAEGTVPRTSPIPATDESLLTGRGLFEMNCRVCHGPQGQGDGPAAANLPIPPPPLTDHVPYHSDRVMFTWITEGIPIDREPKNMPSFKGQLSKDDRWHLVNFLRAAFGSGEFVPVGAAAASR